MDQEVYDNFKGQEYLQDQAMAGQMSAYAPQIQEQVQQARAVLVDQTNPRAVIEDIILKLKGQERSYDGSLIQTGEQLLNDKGINRMRFILSTVVNQNTILSHLEDKEIGRLIVNLSYDIIDDLTLNWKDYDIKDKMLLDHIVDSIAYPAFFALKRALGQNEKNWLGRISMEHISGGASLPKPKKEGFWGKFRL